MTELGCPGPEEMGKTLDKIERIFKRWACLFELSR